MCRLALSSLILFIACEVNNPVVDLDLAHAARTFDQRTVIDDTLTLVLGTSQFIGESDVEIGFSQIYTDSRCPSNADCIWQGMAQIAIWLKAPEIDTLHLMPTIFGLVDVTHTGTHAMLISNRFGISLLQLDPYPGFSTLVVGDTAATLRIEEFVPPLDQSVITLIELEEYNRFSHNPVDSFGIDSLSIDDDSLLIHLNYSGGCIEHDFYTFGSLAWMESSPPIMPITIIHMGNNDFCDAIIHRTIKISLDPVTRLTGYGREVFIEVIPSYQRVYFAW
ncbi:hypothetical protein ACFLZR_01755 [Candidatus Neomarinimicrobiota bacterium]